MPVADHLPRINSQHRWASVSRADPLGRCSVGREMHMVPRHFPQAAFQDRGQSAISRAMVQSWRWRGGLQLEIDIDAVPLSGASMRSGLLEREARLVTPCHDFGQFGGRDRQAVARARSQEGIDAHPAARSHLESQSLRPVAKVPAQEPARLDQSTVGD